MKSKNTGGKPQKQRPFITRMVDKGMGVWNYFSSGVWSDTNTGLKTDIAKTLNLSVRTFLNGNVQTQACAMVYRTFLAIVPALALMVAIGRGFGLSEIIHRELYQVFPAQGQAISYAMTFVDSYLNTSSEGLFVGVGIVFLLWTIISLVINVEESFNKIWGVKEGRSIWRKISDYTAMLLILPVLMVCASGITLLLSSTLNTIFHFEFLTPVVSIILEVASWAFTWLFFAAVYMLIPNTKVKFKNAFIAGVIAGSGFLILQWLFVSGQLYVSRYNAIYGSFAFLPLLLLWMQLAWMICFSGAVICFSSQNIFQFNFDSDVEKMSSFYRMKITVAVAAVITRAFVNRQKPPTALEIVDRYYIPARLLSDILDKLCRAGVISMVVIDEKAEIFGYQPAVTTDMMTVGFVARSVFALGTSDFIPAFVENFPGVEEDFDRIIETIGPVSNDMKLEDMNIINFSK